MDAITCIVAMGHCGCCCLDVDAQCIDAMGLALVMQGDKPYYVFACLVNTNTFTGPTTGSTFLTVNCETDSQVKKGLFMTALSTHHVLSSASGLTAS